VNGAPPAPPIDLQDFRRRSRRIYDERLAARQRFEEHGLLEADAEHNYQVERAKKLMELRAAGKAQSEALVLAEGDSTVAEHKRTRNKEAVLKRAAAMHVEELERNAANLRAEATMSEGI
jgi:hypothetical protein